MNDTPRYDSRGSGRAIVTTTIKKTTTTFYHTQYYLYYNSYKKFYGAGYYGTVHILNWRTLVQRQTPRFTKIFAKTLFSLEHYRRRTNVQIAYNLRNHEGRQLLLSFSEAQDGIIQNGGTEQAADCRKVSPPLARARTSLIRSAMWKRETKIERWGVSGRTPRGGLRDELEVEHRYTLM